MEVQRVKVFQVLRGRLIHVFKYARRGQMKEVYYSETPPPPPQTKL